MDTAQKLDNAINFLKASTSELKEGRLVSLDDFQQQVRSICEELSQVPLTNKEFYADKLNTLANFLQDFETDLRAQQAEVNFALMNLNAKQKALKSYEVRTQSTNKDKPEDGN